jgi:SNF2 family DNA or RNA helicase
MIRQDTIDAFLSRKLASYDWLKLEAPEMIDDTLRDMNPVPDFGQFQPWLHQKVCFLVMMELNRFMSFLDLGAGKSSLSLMILSYRKQKGEKPKAVVFVPFVSAIDTWITEVSTRWPNLKCVAVLGTSAEKRELLRKGDADLYVICYASAVAMLSKVETKPTKKRKKHIDNQEVKELFKGFDMLICDEIHRTKHASTLTFKMCRAISQQCQWAFGLTGTPFGRDLSDLWAQFNLIDFGETLGPTLGLFRACMFSAKKGYFGGMEWKFISKYKPLLTQMIKNRSIRYTIDECADLPPRNYVTKRVDLTSDMATYYREAAEALQTLVKSQGKYQEIASQFVQVRQLASGFMTFKGEDDTRLRIGFDENPKLDLLQELVEALPDGRKMVVFHTFIYTSELISTRLRNMKIKHARVWGGAKHPLEELARFRDDPDCRILVLNTRSGSASLNLQVANYVVFFEQPDSSTDREQAERRCWRPGQVRRVFFFDLMMNKTYDDRMRLANKQGIDLLKAIIDGKVEL